MPAFDRRVRDFEAANTQVLGISTDSPFSHESWAKAVGVSHYPLLSDIHRSTSRDSGVYWPDWNANVRATFLIDRQGTIRFVERYGRGAKEAPRAGPAGCAAGARVVSATPSSTSAPPATSGHSTVSPTINHARSTPAIGWRLRKAAARLGPTAFTPSYHQTWATAPRIAW